jgi:hypothetical protein
MQATADQSEVKQCGIDETNEKAMSEEIVAQQKS